MEFKEFIVEQALILIPVLYIIGAMLKQTSIIKDTLIPLILLVLGVLFSNLMLGFSIESTLQGVLVAGTTVFANQLYKQSKRED
ncbi:hypothetical protein 10S12_2 [uncultured Caudovirales phage]|uniref:Holin n=1 Tax=uncultured Caudovirales phage TaxID=2100421 RepID=A0A2H4JAH4_9CAUD|nr:hypothetical protein 10S12_2 [uncultured Caudovirales phage]